MGLLRPGNDKEVTVACGTCGQWARTTLPSPALAWLWDCPHANCDGVNIWHDDRIVVTFADPPAEPADEPPEAPPRPGRLHVVRHDARLD